MEVLDAMLANGPWFIHNNPLIPKKWHPDENLLKEDVSTIPIWSSYARAMIELRADVELKDNIVVAILQLLEGLYDIDPPFMNVDNNSTGTTPITDKIGKFEDLLTSGQAILVDEAGNPLKKVEFPVIMIVKMMLHQLIMTWLVLFLGKGFPR
ncbi:putative ribonuclease H-like domain-containing protein [Tanacetum coccineum]